MEYETGKVINEYIGIANVFISFHSIDSEKQQERGITSYKLVYFNKRWWIANITWATNSTVLKHPKKNLKNKNTPDKI